MLFKLSTDKTVSEAVVALQAAVVAKQFGVMQVHNLRKTVIDCSHSHALFLPKQQSSVSSKNHRIPDQARNDSISCEKVRMAVV